MADYNLPSYNASTYPYATIAYWDDKDTITPTSIGDWLLLSQQRPYVNGNPDTPDTTYIRVAGGSWARYQLIDGEFVHKKSKNEAYNFARLVNIKWTNYDLLDTDGNKIFPPVKVNGITLIAPPSATVGSLVNLTCKVYGEGGVDFAGFTASVSGNNVAETTIIDNDDTIYFSLFVGWEETATSLTVTVTSTQDPSISTSKTITVINSDSDDSGGGTGGGTGGGSEGGSGDSGDTGGDSGGGTEGGITPEGTLEITENGVYDVTEYAEVNVNVQATEEIKAAFKSGLATGLALYSIGV